MLKKNKRLPIIIALFLLITISIGYAALTTELKINGTANIAAASWNVHFTNIVPNPNNSIASVETEPVLSDNNTKVTWAVTMDKPGQLYEFNVDIINEGTIDAMVSTATEDIVTSALTENQKRYLDYTIKYVNGADIEQYDKLAAGETKTITVKLFFKQDIEPTDLPQNDQNGIILSYTANYVQADNSAVTKRTTPLVIGESVDYTTSLNGQTLSNWKVFYFDENYAYIILDDYLPNAAISDSLKNNYYLYKNNVYNVCALDDRDELLDAISTKSNWIDLLKGTLNGKSIDYSNPEDTNIYAMGSPTSNLWIDSWNKTYPNDKLYTKYIDTDEVDGVNFYTTGYAIGDSENLTGTYADLSNKTGYNNTLYFPHKEAVESCYGYWLASPSTMDDDGDEYVVTSFCYGYLSSSYYDYSNFSIRPIICLPYRVVNQ